MSNQLEYNINDQNDLDEIGETLPNEQPKNNKSKIAIIILSSIIAILVIGMGVYFCLTYIKKDSNDNNNDNNNDNDKNNQFRIYYNISYFNKTTEKIENSFRTEGDHKQFGNINGGKDYNYSDSNYFSMIIPQSAYDNKGGYNKIFLWIHGGAWVLGNKEEFFELCKYSANVGYISVTMGYTLLNDTSSGHASIYRIIDEITACIKGILLKLKDEKINTENIQMVIGGGSAGAHISLLYGYFIKEPIVPIKFIVNIVGPVTINPNYYMANAKDNDTLENLEPTTVEKALKDKKLKKVNYDSVNSALLLHIMNYAIGNNYSESQLDRMIINETHLNENDSDYQNLLKESDLIMSPLNYITKDSPPTINLYGGNDNYVGVIQYSLLKKKYYEVGYGNDTMIYVRYSTHTGIFNRSLESTKIALEEWTTMIGIYGKKFIKNKNN